jgi:hypothetical protein
MQYLLVWSKHHAGLLVTPAAAAAPCRCALLPRTLVYPWCPCSEIILRPYQFCNLTEVVVRDSDDLASLQRKARLAAILGTFQASLVDFPYLRDIWRHNTAEVRSALLCLCLAGDSVHLPLNAAKSPLGALHTLASTCGTIFTLSSHPHPLLIAVQTVQVS